MNLSYFIAVDLGDNLQVGVITYSGAHGTKLKVIRSTWARENLINKSVFIFSGTIHILIKEKLNLTCHADIICCRCTR